MSTKRMLAGILYKKMKGQVVTSELGIIKLGLLLLAIIGAIVIFMFLTGFLPKAIEWVRSLFMGR